MHPRFAAILGRGFRPRAATGLGSPIPGVSLFITLLSLFTLLPTGGTHAAMHRYAVKMTVPPGKAGYSFGSLQYSFYDKNLFAKNMGLGVDYDTDAVYTKFDAVLFDGFRMRLDSKVHAVDWQNLIHYTNPATGVENKDRKIIGRFFDFGHNFEWRLPGNTGWFGIHERYAVAPLAESSGSDIRVKESPSFYSVAAGWRWSRRLSTPVFPGIYTGDAIYIEPGYTTALTEYRLRDTKRGVNITPETSGGPSLRARLLWGRRFFSYWQSSIQIKAVVAAYGQTGSSSDFVLGTPVGGGERDYYRIAGYAFGEFRPTSFALLNWDNFYRLTSMVWLWSVVDFGVLSQGDTIAAGIGAGPYVKLNKQMNLFTRLDIAMNAERSRFVDRLQIYFGLLGSF